MSNYRRAKLQGATYFFTVNCLQRRGNTLLVDHIDTLKSVIGRVHQLHPFHIDAWVILPEHMHCVWTLPEGDADYSTRWRLIKTLFSRQLPKTEHRSTTRLHYGERGIWQRHYWEHLIRDDLDFQRHIDYVHVNPLKHGLVNAVKEWPHSTFHAYVERGIYPHNWCGDLNMDNIGNE